MSRRMTKGEAVLAIRDLLNWNVKCNEHNCHDDPDWSGVAAALEYASAAIEGRPTEGWAQDELRRAKGAS